MKKEKKELVKDVLGVAIIVIAIVVLCIIGVYGTKYFRDFQMVYQGSYRIISGQTPYLDFFFPLGPVIFYVQAIMQLIFGPNLLALAMHVAFLSIILALTFYFLIRKHFSWLFSIFMSICLYYSYNGIIAYPWYNTMAMFFFLLNAIIIIKYLANKQEIPIYVYVFSAVLGCLSFYSKQDTGLLQFVFIGALLFFIEYKNKDKYKKMAAYVVSFAVFSIAAYLFLNSISSGMFAKEFMLAQGSTYARLRSYLAPITFNTIIYSFTFYLVLVLIYLFFKEKDFEKRKTLAALIIFNSVITVVQVTSGVNIQTRVTGLPITLFLLYLYVKDNANLRKVVRAKRMMWVYIIFFFIILMQFNDLSTLMLNNYFTTPLGQMKNIIMGQNRLDEGCYKGQLFYMKENVDDINEIKRLIEENNKSFMVLGEYAFLYCDYGIKPPTNLPLWYYDGAGFIQDEDWDRLHNYIIENKPRIIVEQMEAFQKSKTDIYAFLEEKGYDKIATYRGPSVPQDIGFDLVLFKLKAS